MDENSELTKTQKQNLDMMLDFSELKDYFGGQPPIQNASSQVSKHFTDKVIKGVDVLIKYANLNVSSQPKTVEELMDKKVMREQEVKTLQLKTRKEVIQQELQYLKRQTSIVRTNSEEKILQHKIVLSKEEHKVLVNKLKRQKLERDKIHGEFVQKLQKNIMDSEQNQRREKEQKLRLELKLRRSNIQTNLQKSKRRKQQLLKLQQQSNQKTKKMQTNKFVYQQIEDNYQRSIVMPNLEQKKRKLKELRDYKSFNAEEIKEHQRSYLEQRELHATKRSEVKEDWHYKPPPKSERLEVILEEEKMMVIEKMEEKKKMAEERMTRQANFISRLRENFTPTIDPIKQQEMRQRQQKSIIFKPESSSIRQIGENYMQYAKKHRKILSKTIEERPQSERNKTKKTMRSRDTSMQSKPKTTNYLLLKPKSESYYQQHRRRHISKLSKQQDLPQTQRIKQLKMQADKINQKLGQKQKLYRHTKDNRLKQDTLELLLSSIQAKIGIIQMYQQ